MSDVDHILVLPLPEGAVPQHSIAVLAFFDTAGNTRYTFSLSGDASLSSILGLIELVKAHVFREAEDW